MKLKKHRLLIFCSSLILTLGSCKNSSGIAQKLIDKTITEEEIMYRPNFHFTPQKGWMNDPNGMFFLDGTYHLYYQYYPDGNIWGPMHWGHATSKDMIQWKEQAIAIYPDNNKYIFSGSAVVDTNNTSGFKNGKSTPIVAIYTLHDMDKEKEGKIDTEQQDIAFSNDNGFTWQKFDEGNPVIKNPEIRDFRDPKVTWDEVHKQWIMVLAAQNKVQFYKSSNLINWEFISDFGNNIGAHGGTWECPDFFEMKVEGSNETKWVLIQSLNPGGANGGSGTQYFIGDFDGTHFVLDSNFSKKVKNGQAVWIDYGKDNYAGVTWNNIPSTDGRKLFIGWMSNWNYSQQVPTFGWRGSTTIAREIRLINKSNNYYLVSNPVKELNNYISKTIKKKSLIDKEKVVIVKPKEIDLTQAIIEFNLKNIKEDNYQFTLSNEIGEHLTFGINTVDNYLFIDRSISGKIDFSEKFASSISKATIDRNQKEATFKIILDKTSIELFYNNGEKVMTEIFFPNKPFITLSASSKEGIVLSTILINQLKTNQKN
ncbi:glycoside hydrolase family 32 protein [Flavobacterium sp. MAHUQ-51]|uniref:glycoside hydrolase family 32 protein n=1 Tax=Flavobacterium sp. GCM10022190 TaxID=3252639 RepID=UPI0036086C83